MSASAGDGPALSVVVARTPRPGASHAADADVPAWLAALRRSCAGVDAEFVIVGDQSPVAWDDPACVAVLAPPGSLVPVRWALGLGVARGAVVAFTTDLCAVDPGWARAALDAIARGAAAVGGPLVPAPGLTRTARAVYHLRFGAIPAHATGCVAVDDVAADNAAYRRATLLEVAAPFDEGFWEVEANRRLRVAGHALRFCADMRAAFIGGEALWPLAGQRFAHGRHAGAWRVATGMRRPWQVVAAAPLVPAVLLGRALGRARTHGRGVGALTVPAFLVLASAWAAGEAVGAATGWRGTAGR